MSQVGVADNVFDAESATRAESAGHIGATASEPPMEASGILFISNSKVLLLRRGDAGDEPYTWGLPAGKTEAGETALEGALRETREEVQHIAVNEVKEYAHVVKDGVSFTTFVCLGDEFTPVLNDEHTDAAWFAYGNLPDPVHPGLIALLQSDEIKRMQWQQMNELDLARAMASGHLASPQRIGTLALFAMRITGTGVSYRSADQQYVFKSPENYLTDEFLQRCQGLPVIWEHTEEKTLATKEYKEKTIGSVMLPYIQGDEVWCIARVQDGDAADLMQTEQLSTSPSVIVSDVNDSTISLDSGKTMLLEGKPRLLDHLAVCETGVWDKGGAPRGIKIDNFGATKMADKDEVKKDSAVPEAKKDSEAPAWFQTFCDSNDERMTAMEKKLADKKDSEDEKEAKKDSLEQTTITGKKDSAKKDDDGMEAMADKKDAKKDSEDEKEEAKKDSASVRALLDDNATMKAQLAALQAAQRGLSDDDYNALSDSQTKADSVSQALGITTPRPMANESPLAYRRRLVGKFKEHSATYKTMDLSALPEDLFGVVEAQVYKDAEAAAHQPMDVTAEMPLREVRKTTAAGHKITEFVGHPGACWDQFKSVSQIARFNSAKTVH